MGEVYRATDTNLGRQVAIKVLPEAFASDPERVARFEREAKTLASLNHPNTLIPFASSNSPAPVRTCRQAIYAVAPLVSPRTGAVG